jgi:hypothetical protein
MQILSDEDERMHRRGQALPLIALALFTLIGLGALAVDVGYWRYEQRVEQAAADSAAMAGADEIPYVTGTASPNPITVIANRDAATNGFTNGSNNVTVTVNNPPLTGPNAGSTSAVEVIITKSGPTFLSKIFGRTSQQVGARAVASRQNLVRNCIIGLDTSGNAINFNSSTVNIPECGIMSNGSYLSNSSTVTASSIGYATTNGNPSGNTYPKAQPAQAAPVSDPCPTISGCAYLKANPPTSGNCIASPTYTDNSAGLTLSPGRYCAQIIINAGTSPGPVTFSAGVYDLESGMNINSGIPEVDGNGVTFYLNGGSVNFDGTAKMNLVAPSTGNTAGILLFGTSNFTASLNINHGATGPQGAFAGAIYIPNSTLIVDGVLSTWLLVVAHDVVLNSDSSVSDSTNSFPGLTLPAALVE